MKSSATFSRWSTRLYALTSVLCFGVLLLLGSSASGQALSGIVGTVTDTSGAVVEGAKVTAINTATNVESHAVTSAVGAYFITDLIPGEYTVTVQKSGFSAASIQGVTVETGGKKSTVNAALKTGTINETVSVEASQISLETDSPEISTSIEHEMIEELPIEFGANSSATGTPRGRAINAFLNLTPGVNDSYQRINGAQSFQGGVSFNGVSESFSYNGGMTENINPPFEMVSEASVVSTSFSSQTGLGQGTAAYGFASGTNVLHGSAFEIMRNSYFDAPGAYPALSSTGHKEVPQDHENNYGFSLGGPVIIPHVYNGKNKTFFHFDMEWYKYNQSYSGTLTVPTDAMRGGDFSQNYFTCTPVSQGGTAPCGANGRQVVPIYVPQVWATNPGSIPAGCQIPGYASPAAAAGQQFPNNQIPTNCFSQLSKGVLALIPRANNTGAANPNPNIGNLFNGVSSYPAYDREWGISIDHNLTEKQKIHGSFWHTPYHDYQYYAPQYAITNPLSQQGVRVTLGNGLLLNYSNPITNRLVMTVGALGTDNFSDWSFGPATIAGLPSPLAQSLVQNPSGTPGFNFNNGPNGINSFGAGAPPYQPGHAKGLTISNNWIYTRRSHTLSFGAEFHHTTNHSLNYNPSTGVFNFNSFTTSNNLQNPDANGFSESNTGNSFASFLLGDVDSAGRANVGQVKLRNFGYSPYVQDDIKVSRRLTVNMGLRWDILVPFTLQASSPAGEVLYAQLNLPDAGAHSTITGQPLLGGYTELGTCGTCAGYDRASIHWKNLGPRLGFEYQLNNKTVIRSGYSLSFLPGAAYNYGDSAIANYFTGLLAGFLPASTYSNVGYPGNGLGNWDNKNLFPLPVPAALGVSSSVCNGVISEQCVEMFSRNPAAYPYTQSWNAGVQRELPWKLFFSADYVGNRGLHLAAGLNQFNQLNPALLSKLCPNGVTPGYQGGTQCVLGDSWYDTSPGGAQSVLGPGGALQGRFGKDANGLYSPYQEFFNDMGGYSGSATLMSALVPYPQYGNGIIYNSFDNSGKSTYNALQTQLQKRLSNGVSLLANYTLSRSMTNAESGRGGDYSAPLNKYNQGPEYSIASFDQTHAINIVSVYELPIGPGKPFLNHARTLMNNIIGGWQLSGIVQYRSGTPLSVGANSYSGSPFNNGFNRANIVPGVNPYIGSWHNTDKVDANGNPLPILNPAAFSDPGPWVPGNAPRNLDYLRLPWSYNENVALGKKFFMGERVHAELRVEFFNLLNRDLKNCAPNTNISSGTGIGGFGAAAEQCQSNRPRQGQAFFRIQF
ncbi:MAG TPA: TonB-dependent receptor [Terriglobales bacterium]|nr:TonB-dependent receptor [Terriglobales bacterium]